MEAKPVRLQRSRKKGAKLVSPNGLPVLCVTRGTFYGNPFKVGHHYKRGGGGIPRLGLSFTYMEAFEGNQTSDYTTIKTAAEAVEWYRWYVGTWSEPMRMTAAMELRGKNLACWCGPDDVCHADILLEIANAPEVP